MTLDHWKFKEQQIISTDSLVLFKSPGVRETQGTALAPGLERIEENSQSSPDVSGIKSKGSHTTTSGESGHLKNFRPVIGSAGSPVTQVAQS